MAYSIAIPADIGSTGLTILVTFQDSTGVVHATLRNLATTEVADGFYRFSSASVPDSYRGYVYFHTGTYTSAFSDIEILAAVSINPQENENADVKTSSLGGMGTGAFAITVTVTDGTNPLQSAIVSVFDGSSLAGRLSTDASGNATFSLNAGTYTVTVFKGGYQFAATTRTVTGSQSGTLVDDLEMSGTTPVPPPDPDLCRLFGYLTLPSGEPAENVQVFVTLVANRPVGTTGGSVITDTTISEYTNNLGYVEIDVIRTDAIDPTPTYKIRCQEANIQIANISLTTATQDINDLI